MNNEREVAAEAVCLRAYKETAEFYSMLCRKMGNLALGYKILYGPPKIYAPILFLGYQPGGGAIDAAEGEIAGERRSWPAKLEYTYAMWKLAIMIRGIWDLSVLQECIGLNRIFFRSPSIETWESTPVDIRSQVDSFCMTHVRSIFEATKPEKIIMFGFGKIAEFQPSGEPLQAARSRLVQRGTLWGKPAAEVIHLSGARISNENRFRIAQYLKSQKFA